MRTDERTDVQSWGDPDFLHTRYITGNVIRCELAIGRNCEKELALLLAMVVEKGLVNPERVQAALESAKLYVQDRTFTPVAFCTCGISPGKAYTPDPRETWRHQSHCMHSKP